VATDRTQFTRHGRRDDDDDDNWEENLFKD